MNVERDTYSTDMGVGGAQAILASVLFIAIYTYYQLSGTQ